MCCVCMPGGVFFWEGRLHARLLCYVFMGACQWGFRVRGRVLRDGNFVICSFGTAVWVRNIRGTPRWCPRTVGIRVVF